MDIDLLLKTNMGKVMTSNEYSRRANFVRSKKVPK